MPTLKVRCPECDEPIRKSIDAVEEPTEFTLKCPKCKSEFVAEAQPEAPPKKAAAKKPIKAAPRDDDDEDEEDDTPRKKKGKKAAAGTSPAVLYGGIAAALLAIGGIVALVLATGGSKEKEKDQAKAETPANVEPIPLPSTKQQPKKKDPTTKPDPKTEPEPKVTPKEPEIPGLPPLPPPPRVRIAGSAAPGGKLDTRVEKPPPFIPLTKEEDPFVRARSFAPDGKIPPLAKLPAANARPLLTLDPGGHTAFVSRVFITPDGTQVITVSKDKAVRIWDIQSGDAIHTIRLPAGVGDEGSLEAAALSPDGKRLAVGGHPLKSVRPGGIPIFFINVETGTLIKTINAARDVINSLDYSPDGNRIAVGCLDGSVQLFNVNTGGSAGLVERAHRGPILEVRFSPNKEAKSLATLGGDGAVKLWDLGNPAKNYTLDVLTLRPMSIAWTSTGHGLAVGGQSGEVLNFSVETGRLFRRLPKQELNGTTAEINQLQFLKGDREIVCGGIATGAGGWAYVISAETGAARVKFTGHSNTVFAVNVSADGARAVTSGGSQHETFVWSTADGAVVNRLCGGGNAIWGIGWANDGKSVAWGNDNKRNQDGHAPLEFTFRFDDFGPGGVPDESKYQQAQLADRQYGVKRIGKSEVAMGPSNGQPHLFKLPYDEPIYSASIVPGQKRAIICGAASLVSVDPSSGKIIRKFQGHTGNILTAASSPDGRYFVTGSSDQTIRVWHPEFEDPLLSVFVAGREWIAWTPQGYYSCSPHGEGLIAWQINAGPTKLPQVHPAARFRASMYQPALIKYLIPAGDMPMALAMARKFDQALVQTTSVADIVPPEVTIDSPAKDDVVIDGGTYTVKASAKGKHPVTSMRLLVDGRPFQGAQGVKKFEKPDVNAETSWDVELAPGLHSFAVIAETAVSKSMSKVALLRRSGEPPKPNLYILAMGVSAYTGGVNPLRYAASDAHLIAKAFQARSKGVFAKIEVKVLTDSQASKQGIRDGLEWLKSKMTAMDVGIVSFSGHGTRDQFGRFSLVPVDMTMTDPATAFSGDEFKTRLDAMPGRLVAILDACHSGTVAGSERPARPDTLVRDLAAEDSGVIVMCSSLGREVSLESPITKAGFFTLGLVEGLTEHGDVDEDGVVYIHELDMYANARVKQLSMGTQNSTTGRPASIRPFPVAIVGKPPAKDPPPKKKP